MKTKNLFLILIALGTVTTAKAGPQLYTVVCQEPTRYFNLTLNLITPNRAPNGNGGAKDASILDSVELKKVSPKSDVPVEVLLISSKQVVVSNDGGALKLNLVFRPSAPRIGETYSLDVLFDLTKLDVKKAIYTVENLNSVSVVSALEFNRCTIQ